MHRKLHLLLPLQPVLLLSLVLVLVLPLVVQAHDPKAKFIMVVRDLKTKVKTTTEYLCPLSTAYFLRGLDYERYGSSGLEHRNWILETQKNMAERECKKI